jgi:hypothetical protein
VTKSTINKRALELICHSHSHNCIKTSGAQVWRGSAVAATTTRILVFGYGLDFLIWLWFGLSVWYASLGERYTTLVSYWF